VSRITSVLELALRDQVLKAAVEGDLAQVESYLAMKGWVNMYDNARESILIKAAKAEQAVIINKLLEVRADVNHADLNGQTALHFLASNKEVSNNAELVIESLKKAQLNFDAKDELGETPLMKAAQSRNVRMVEILIEAGADLKGVNNEGKDALKLTRLIGVKAIKIRRMIKKALKQKA
jgi:ankyrin repeat protein